jgi:modulator of FtsH protease
VTAYDPTEWRDLFVATAGASAALLGLLFVAVSINLDRILQFAWLPGRALETLVLLLSVLVISIAGLIPGQSHVALGLEVLLIGLAVAVFALRQPVALGEGAGLDPPARRLSRLVLRFASVVPILIAGLTLLLEAGGGLYWLVAGIVFAIAGAVAGAWVLLVEILR